MTFAVVVFSGAFLFIFIAGVLEVWLLTKYQTTGIFTRGFFKMAKLFRQFVWKWISNRHNQRDNNEIQERSNSDELEPSSSLCSSSDCIRCSRNLDILSTALTKLSYYTLNSDGNQANSRQEQLVHLVADVKKSLDKTKKDIDTLEENYSFDDNYASTSGSTSNTSNSLNIPVQNPLVFRMSSLRKNEFWSPNIFSNLNQLCENWRKIALECLHLYQSPLSETKSFWKVNSTIDGTWEIAQLIDQGRITNAAKFCPLTSQIIKNISHFISECYFGDASFSIVHPGTKIATHCGSTNCRIRCHIGEFFSSSLFKMI